MIERLPTDFTRLLNLPVRDEKPKPLPPGEYVGQMLHNESGYYIKLADGRVFPIDLPRPK